MIYIGTSGFSYDDWKGPVYPSNIKKADMLGFYTGMFSSVEINSSYYAIPSPSSFESMNRKTPAHFRFVVKAHKDMTHTDAPDDGVFDRFREAVEPIRSSGKLGCILAQYPWSFKNNPDNVGRIGDVRRLLNGYPVVVEFRNSEWVNDETSAMLRDLDMGFCCVDEPALPGLMPGMSVATSSIGYVRFHGRNRDKWWKHDQPYERYDYLYTQQELEEWVPRVRNIESVTTEQYLFFNNHYKGKSVQNARMLAKMLGIELPPIAGKIENQLTFGEY